MTAPLRVTNSQGKNGGPVGNFDEHQGRYAPRAVNPEGAHPVLLVCEHASRAIPPEFGDLGLSTEALESHIAWDPGALTVALALSDALDASLVYASASRLIYDCNRPPKAPDAMPAKSEATVIPGNAALSEADRQARVDAYYRPFEDLLEKTVAAKAGPPVIVTIHSFTPVYLGRPRAVEIGILHDTDARLADAMLREPSRFTVERNQPYGPDDGVTHTLRRHALPGGLLNVMIEIRNDLLETPEGCVEVTECLQGWLDNALRALAPDQPREATA